MEKREIFVVVVVDYDEVATGFVDDDVATGFVDNVAEEEEEDERATWGIMAMRDMENYVDDVVDDAVEREARVAGMETPYSASAAEKAEIIDDDDDDGEKLDDAATTDEEVDVHFDRLPRRRPIDTRLLIFLRSPSSRASVPFYFANCLLPLPPRG